MLRTCSRAHRSQVHTQLAGLHGGDQLIGRVIGPVATAPQDQSTGGPARAVQAVARSARCSSHAGHGCWIT